jgi:D-beta-D-heptose 7-phosphate kinase/D-beta-D-heptose 1-phosphate adenosyltransferase
VTDLPHDRECPHEADLLAVLRNLGCPHVLVLGDLILDRYTWGRAERISPEAPVPVLLQERTAERPGGAAGVSAMLAALGADVACLGLVGSDAEGETLRKLLSSEGVTAWHGIIDPVRPTTLKHRFLSAQLSHAQLLRVDRESSAPLDAHLAAKLADDWSPQLSSYDTILVSDYGKGFCVQGLLQAILARSRELGIPVVVDPARSADYSKYRGASIIKPNRQQCAHVTGRVIDTPAAAGAAGHEICRTWDVACAVVTLDRDGLVVAARDQQVLHLPARRQSVYDITGAGDTVLALLGLGLGARLPLDRAAALAVIAGGVQVQHVGVTRISRDQLAEELSLAADLTTHQRHCAKSAGRNSKLTDGPGAALVAAAARQAGRRVVFTNGCFAALHAGHVAYLREARSLGDVLIVALNSSDSIRRLKGDRPIIRDEDRLHLMAALEFVDYVLLFDDDTPHRLLSDIRPDVLVKGGTTDVVIGREIVEAYGGQIHTLAPVPGISTTRLVQEMPAGEW